MRKSKLLELIEKHPLVISLWSEEDNGWFCDLKNGYVSTFSQCGTVHVSNFEDQEDVTQNKKDVSDLTEIWEHLKDGIVTDKKWEEIYN